MKEWPITQDRLDCLIANAKNDMEDTNVINLPTEEQIRDGWYLVVKDKQ